MNAKYFSGSETIGFEVKSAKDIFAAKELGLFLCDEEDYYFDDVVVETDEDGNDIDRDATEDEKTERAIEHLKNGGKVFATFYADNYMLVDKRATTMQSDFFVGQRVFFLLENKIAEGTIKQINLTAGEDEKDHFRNICERIYNRIRGYVSPNESVNPYHMLCNDAQELIRTSIKNIVSSNRAVISYVTQIYGTNVTISIPLRDVFATKEELIKHLMEG